MGTEGDCNGDCQGARRDLQHGTHRSSSHTHSRKFLSREFLSVPCYRVSLRSVPVREIGTTLEVGILRHNFRTKLGKSAKCTTIPVLRGICWYLSFVIPMCEAEDMSGHTMTYIQGYTHTYTRIRCAHARRLPSK